jgi:uncharacterized protein YlxW (UPF0749 family)
MIGGITMSEKSDKLRAMLEKEKERRIKLNNRIEILERRIQDSRTTTEAPLSCRIFSVIFLA